MKMRSAYILRSKIWGGDSIRFIAMLNELQQAYLLGTGNPGFRISADIHTFSEIIEETLEKNNTHNETTQPNENSTWNWLGAGIRALLVRSNEEEQSGATQDQKKVPSS